MQNNIQNVTQEFLDSIKLPNPYGKKLNYLLVVPRYRQDDYAYFFPIGLAMVSSALKASGRNVQVLNLNYKENHLGLLRDAIAKNNIDVVLSGGLSFQYDILKEIFDTAKMTKPEIITIAGGGIISAEPDVAMQALETADYGVIGEGEITVNELAYALENDNDIAGLQGIVNNSGNTPPATEISNLDMLPFPDYESFEFDVLISKEVFSIDDSQMTQEDNRTIISLSRSCPYNCTFCFHPLGKKYRRRSMDSAFSELGYLINMYKIEYFRFADEMFIFNDKYIKEFCKRIIPYNIKFCAQTRVDTVNKEKLQMLKDAGCVLLTMGVESADNSVLKSMKKNITVEQIENAFDLAKEVGIDSSGVLILGDPCENEHTIRNTLNWRIKHSDYMLQITWIISYPGSEDYKIACERGVIEDRVQFLKEGCPQVNISQLSDADYWEMVNRIRIFSALFNAGIYVDIGSIKLSMLNNKLHELVKGDAKVAIWPTTIGHINLLNNISPQFIVNKNVFLVNINPHHVWAQKAALYGQIFTPRVIADKHIQTVLCLSGNPLMPRLPEEIEEMCKRDYPSVKQFIKLVDLLTDV